MRKIVRFLIVTILSGLIFGLIFARCVDFSIDTILGSVYENARPEVRENTFQELEKMCESLRALEQRDDFEIDIDPRLDEQKLIELCKKNLEGRELFVEFTKAQTGNIEDVMGNNPDLAKYSSFFKSSSKNTIISLVLIGILAGLLLLVEKNYLDFLRSIGKILLTTSLFLFFAYLLPKVLGYFMDVDTSFLLEMDETSYRPEPLEVILVMLPIVLDTIFTDSLVVYAGSMLVVYVLIRVFVHFKK